MVMKNSYLYIFAGVVLLGVLFLIFRSNQPPTQKNNNETAQNASSTQTSAKIFELVIKEKKIVTGPETIQLIQDDNLLLKITCDEDEELHVHGYDKSVDLEKDKPVELSFKADVSGRFVFELEKSKTDIGVIEVQPK